MSTGRPHGEEWAEVVVELGNVTPPWFPGAVAAGGRGGVRGKGAPPVALAEDAA